jgi:hypothetical protein
MQKGARGLALLSWATSVIPNAPACLSHKLHCGGAKQQQQQQHQPHQQPSPTLLLGLMLLLLLGWEFV